MDMDAENNKIGGNNLINKCDIIASNCLNIHDTITKLRKEMDDISSSVKKLETVIDSSRVIDLTPVYTALRPHTDKWFRPDGTLRNNLYSRNSIPICAYRYRRHSIISPPSGMGL